MVLIIFQTIRMNLKLNDVSKVETLQSGRQEPICADAEFPETILTFIPFDEF